jgi:hypothetical protein
MRAVFFAMLLVACDSDETYLGAVREAIALGPKACCAGGKGSTPECEKDAPTRCPCLQNARITTESASKVPSHGSEPVRDVTTSFAGPNGKGSCTFTVAKYSGGTTELQSGGCRCE